MNTEAQKAVFQVWKEEFRNKLSLETQYPNAKDDIDKTGLWCEISSQNETREKDGWTMIDDEYYISYSEEGEMTFTVYDCRGEGNGPCEEMAECIKNFFTDQPINSDSELLNGVEFYEARILPLAPSDENYILQVIAPFETQFLEKCKEAI